MAITCSRCGKGFDVTLFQFGHGVRCDCGEWVDLERGHTVRHGGEAEERTAGGEREIGGESGTGDGEA